MPSGVWDETEYAKLPEYDREMWEQPAGAFGCHQADGSICSGWLGYKDPLDLLAVRLGISGGILDPVCAEYETNVPLFASGQEAADHGMKDYEHPGPAAAEVIRKITTKKEAT